MQGFVSKQGFSLNVVSVFSCFFYSNDRKGGCVNWATTQHDPVSRYITPSFEALTVRADGAKHSKG